MTHSSSANMTASPCSSLSSESDTFSLRLEGVQKKACRRANHKGGRVVQRSLAAAFDQAADPLASQRLPPPSGAISAWLDKAEAMRGAKRPAADMCGEGDFPPCKRASLTPVPRSQWVPAMLDMFVFMEALHVQPAPGG